ncbi:MAG: hypothetical protein WBN10_17135 [Polyangiales bacterium]
MMDITDLVVGFQSFLASSTKALKQVGSGPDEEEWDDFVEAAFALFVTRPVESRSGVSMDLVYDVWRPDGFETEIWVRLRALPCDVMIGSRGEGDSIPNYVFENATVTAGDFVFAFRGFSNLLHPESGPVEHVMGEVQDRGVGYPPGTQICVHASRCRFEIG